VGWLMEDAGSGKREGGTSQVGQEGGFSVIYEYI
jgi:hypothetical protein